jgi:hypothetical protein
MFLVVLKKKVRLPGRHHSSLGEGARAASLEGAVGSAGFGAADAASPLPCPAVQEQVGETADAGTVAAAGTTAAGTAAAGQERLLLGWRLLVGHELHGCKGVFLLLKWRRGEPVLALPPLESPLGPLLATGLPVPQVTVPAEETREVGARGVAAALPPEAGA